MTQNEFPEFEEPQHGSVECITVSGKSVRAGDRVRLCPRKSADIMDIALSGKSAVIEALERDFDDNIHVAVVLEDDPGRDLGLLRQPGHRFFFSPEEIEPLPPELHRSKPTAGLPGSLRGGQ